ncbi:MULTISPECIES: TetR/AcrR family transcriptional regulator [unclassified Rhodococcus (in: high G+C Gram-positive bacteria)]|jgi:AcrR family transcriptional regulator|uniref:TetR/AcrR family transcriptional regulator n=1 Tax=unclassified Rhodococcus (in: high G+C Gram-positive bacteria) TaxID=192944 RepID=UPI0002F0560E|nr:TetR/AcrR family transcriptional regulator [Rhodococcus sp. DK17]
MTEVAVQRRPRNRKQLIVAAAAKQFERRGFHDAAIADIAADVGITGPALYRHFRGKQNLLAAAVEFEIEGLEAAYAAPQPGLRDLLEYAAGKSLGQNRASALWERNQAYLDPTMGAELRDRYQKAIAPLREAIQTARPGLDGPSVELLVGGAHAVLSSNRLFRRGKLEPSRARMLMTEAASAVCEMTDLGVVDQAQSVHGEAGGRIMPASRREAILEAAVTLFAERGYQAVGMDDIGTAAGITGPTLYHHFPGKSAILVTVITRCLDALYFDVSGALSGTDDPALALDAALASFVRINVEHGDALSALLTEVVNVPEDERAPIRRLQHDYASEWVALLIRVRPELAAPEAEALTRTAQSVINRMRRQLRGDPVEVRNQLNGLGSAVLGLTGPTSSGHQ